MENNLIMFRTMTQVLRAKDILKRFRIFSTVVRTPADYRQGSCGYSVLVKKDFENAINVLKRNRICFSGIGRIDYL